MAFHWVLSAVAVMALIAALVTGDQAFAKIAAFASAGTVAGATLSTFEPVGAWRVTLVAVWGDLRSRFRGYHDSVLTPQAERWAESLSDSRSPCGTARATASMAE